jgi:DNA-directed RNA polymerase specialized sigma24 family protein
MLGSLTDAEDALQDTLLTGWQGLKGFEGRASIRTWLYRIATNRCLNALRSASRRPAKEWNIPGVEAPEPTHLGEVVWLEPFPDALLEGAIDVPLGPLPLNQSVYRIIDEWKYSRTSSQPVRSAKCNVIFNDNPRLRSEAMNGLDTNYCASRRFALANFHERS